MMMPLIIANFILGMRIWTTRTYGKVNLVYSLLCVVFYCVLMRLSMVYMKNYHVQKADQLGDVMFQAIFYVNIVLTLCLIPSGWWKGKVIFRSNPQKGIDEESHVGESCRLRSNALDLERVNVP